jgi:hypothetical protein
MGALGIACTPAHHLNTNPCPHWSFYVCMHVAGASLAFCESASVEENASGSLPCPIMLSLHTDRPLYLTTAFAGTVLTIFSDSINSDSDPTVTPHLICDSTITIQAAVQYIVMQDIDNQKGFQLGMTHFIFLFHILTCMG